MVETFNTPHAVALTHSMDQRMRRLRESSGMSMSEIHRAALQRFLDQADDKNATCTVCLQTSGNDCTHFEWKPQ